MSKGKEYYRSNVLDNAYADFYVATNTAMLEYEYIVGRYDEASPTLAAQADTYILDSAIGDESVGNEETLERAVDLGADIVVCADVLNDTTKTTERNIEMLQLVEERNVDMEVMVPIQHDEDTMHVEHYNAMVRACDVHGFDLDDYKLMLGGLKESSPTEQIQSAINLRERVGLDRYIHALGMGISQDWIATIRQCPWLIDSFDNSSVVQNIVNGGVMTDIEMEYVDFPMPRGLNSTVISAQFVEALLDFINYLIGSDIREEDAIIECQSEEIAEIVESHQLWNSEDNQLTMPMEA